MKLCLAGYLQVGNSTHFKTHFKAEVEDLKMRQESKRNPGPTSTGTFMAEKIQNYSYLESGKTIRQNELRYAKINFFLPRKIHISKPVLCLNGVICFL